MGISEAESREREEHPAASPWPTSESLLPSDQRNIKPPVISQERGISYDEEFVRWEPLHPLDLACSKAGRRGSLGLVMA